MSRQMRDFPRQRHYYQVVWDRTTPAGRRGMVTREFLALRFVLAFCDRLRKNEDVHSYRVYRVNASETERFQRGE